MGLQKINWSQIDSITVPSGYTVQIGKIDGPIDAIYSENIYLSGTPISDLYLNSGSFSQGVLTLTSNSGNTITVSGFEYDFDRYTTGFTYSDNTFTIVDRSGYTLTASFNILTGLTINGDLDLNGDLNITGNTTLNGGFIATTISATTYQNLPIDPNIFVTGVTYGNNTLTINDNNNSSFVITINDLTGLTINGDLSVSGDTNLNTLFSNIISATTISGGTLYGDGSNLTNIDNIYTVDGYLLSNRIVDLSGNTLSLRRTSNINDRFLNGLDESGNILFEIRSSITNPAELEFANLFIGKNAGRISTSNVRTNLVVGNTSMTGITSGVKNTVFGNNSLTKLIRGSFNSIIGDTVAINFTGATTGTFGDDNVFIGNGSALNQLTGRNNVYIGTNTRQNATSGDGNTIVGKNAGFNNITGSNNVFIGLNAGRNETGSNLLYIENTTSSTPLIYGDFANDLLRFNGKVGVNVLPGTFQFDVNGTSRFSNTVQLDTVNLSTSDTKILSLSTGNTIQYRSLSDIISSVTGDTYVTGFTYNNSNKFTIFDNSGSTFSVLINELTGLTINGDLSVSGNTNLNYLEVNTISATTISGQTFYGDGRNLQGIPKWYAESDVIPTVYPYEKPYVITGSTGQGSFALGPNAQSLSFDQISFGDFAGRETTGASRSTFIGYGSGIRANDSDLSNFIGQSAGSDSKNSNNSNFIGIGAGQNSKNAGFSNFIGYNAGYNINGETIVGFDRQIRGFDSNFIGNLAGSGALYASGSTFIGTNAGSNANYARFSNFIGYLAGKDSTNASYSTLIGFNVGTPRFGFSKIGKNNIIIGNSITLPNGTTDSINIGGVLFGINTNFDTFGGSPSDSPTTTGKIGIGVVTPLNRLHVEDTIDPVRFVGLQSGTTETRILTSDNNGIIKYKNLSDITISGNYLPLSGGTVTDDVLFQSGITATTISGQTFYGVGSNKQVIYNNNGILSGSTGFTYDGTNVGIGTESPTNLLHITGSTDPVRIQGLQLSNDNNIVTVDSNGVLHYSPYSGLTNDKWISGGSFDNRYNILYLGYNTGGGFRIYLDITGNTGNTLVNASRYFISGSTPTGYVLVNGDRWYNTNNGIEYVWINDGNSSQWVQPATIGGGGGGTTTIGDYLVLSGLTANTINVNQIGISGDCVNDLYVSNIHSCSPLNINPLNEGDINFGSSTSGISIQLSEGKGGIGIGTRSPTNKLHIVGSENPVRIEGLQSGDTNNKVVTINNDGVLASSTLPQFASTLPVSFKLGFNGIPNYEVFGGTGVQNFGLLDRGMFVAFDLETALKLPHTTTATDYVYSFRVTTHEQFGGVQNNVGVRTVLASTAGEFPYNTIAPATYLSQTSTNYALQYSDVVVNVPKNYLGQPVYYIKFEIIMERFAGGSTSVIGANLRFN